MAFKTKKGLFGAIVGGLIAIATVAGYFAPDHTVVGKIADAIVANARTLTIVADKADDYVSEDVVVDAGVE